MKKIQSAQIDFNRFTTTAPVISAAQKFVLPVGSEVKEPLVYPEGHEKAGQPVADWKGNPLGETGIVFVNHGDGNTTGSVTSQGIIIVNQVTAEQADLIKGKVAEFVDDPDSLTEPQLQEVLRYAFEELSLGDRYDSTREWRAKNFTPVGAPEENPDYGLQKRDSRDICQAVKCEPIELDETGRQYPDGAILVKHGDDVRAVQPEIFKETYLTAEGEQVDLEKIPEVEL